MGTALSSSRSEESQPTGPGSSSRREQLVGADSDAIYDVYQRAGGTTTLISTGPAGGNGNFDAGYREISADGAHVFFQTQEQLVAADTDAQTDVYDRSGSTTSLLSTGPAGGNGALAPAFEGPRPTGPVSSSAPTRL